MFLKPTLFRGFTLWLSIAVGPLSAWAAVPPAAVEFIENRGQWPAPVSYAARLAAGQLFLGPQGFTYALLASRPHRTALPDSATLAPARRGHAYRVHFEGSRRAAVPQGRQATGLLSNFFLGNDSSTWVSQAPSFREVRYEQLYPGTSLRVYENARQQLEYTFTVRPGGQPAAIGLRYEGTDGLALDTEGNLRIATSVGTVTELAPRAWQTTANGQQAPVACAFILEKNTVRFRLGSYDARRPLVIDPVVLFASFTGSTADNWGHTATYDQQGSLYSAGSVFSSGYPTTSGAFDASFNGSFDMAIIKYNTAVAGPGARVYATYLGGSQADIAHRLVVDSRGELIVLGSTSSLNFPTGLLSYSWRFRGGPSVSPESGYDYRNGADLFVARLSANGRRLLGSTYLGGSGTDGLPLPGYGQGGPNRIPQLGYAAWRGDVQVDADGRVYVASSTASPDFPGISSFQTSYRRGATDAVVCCLSPNLRQLHWSAFLGGSAADAAFSLALAPNGLVYVAGASLSADLPVTAGAYQPAARGGTDGFAAALSRDGRTLYHLCRTGTADTDVVDFVQADANSTIYLAGRTLGNFPGSAGSPGGGGIFMQQLSPDLSRSLFAGTFGVRPLSPELDLTAFRADDCGRLYLAAVGSPAGLPLTEGNRPAVATYVARLSAQARTLEFAACYGGGHTHGISRFSPEGTLYQALCGNCLSVGDAFPIPPGAYYYVTRKGNSNCNDASLKIAVAPEQNASFRSWCVDNGPLPLGGSPVGGVWSGPGVQPAPGGGYHFVPTAALLGANGLTYTPAGGTCASSWLLIRVVPPVAAIIDPIGGPYCASSGLDIGLRAQPGGGEFSGPGVRNGRFSTSAAGPGTHTISYLVNQNGLCGSGTLTVVVLGTRLQARPDTVQCAPPYRPFQLWAAPAGGLWSGPGVSPTGWFDPAAVVRGGTTTSTAVVVDYTLDGTTACASRHRVGILLAPAPPVLNRPELPECASRPEVAGYAPYTVEMPALPADYRAICHWDFGDGQASRTFRQGSEVVSHTYTRAGTFTPVLHIDYQWEERLVCPRSSTLAPLVIAEPQPLPNIITPNGDGLNDFFVQREFCELPELRVYSRWGQQVYHAAYYRNDWGAAGLPEGTYYYRLDGRRAHSVKGWLEVQR